MKRNAVVEAVLTPDMIKWLRSSIKPLTFDTEVEVKQVKTPRPVTKSYKNIIIKATVASETDKAYNFKVVLDASKYSFKFPFTPTLYIWMPKYCSHKRESGYWEVDSSIAMENLNKALLTLKRKLLNSYGYEAEEVIKINAIHLA